MKYKELIEILTQDKYKDLLDEEVNINIKYITSDLDFGEFNLDLMEVEKENGKINLITELISIDIEEKWLKWRYID